MLLHLLSACSGGDTQITAPPVLQGPRPDVVVVTLDTTRADRIGAYGYAPAQTDTIDRLANQGIRFEHAYSPLPLTIPAHATLFTGLLPFHHNIRGNGDNVLAPEFTTLAEILRKEGWATAASVAAFVTTRQWGFSQGFGAYFDSMPEQEPGVERNKNFWHNERSGELVVDDALNWLAGQPEDQPVFLWVHLYDAHFPYVARGAYAESMKDRPYDAELAYVDDQVGRLVDAFEGRDVLWALVGDHGESLGEHDEVSHGLFNYDATQHVPWIVSGAGVPAGVVSAPVSTADLTPTLLKMLGVAVPDGLDGKPQPGSAVTPYSESYLLSDRFRLAPHRTVVDGRLKLIATPKPELYDLDADPKELDNLADRRPEDVARLMAKLTALDAKPPSAKRASMDADTLSQLAALGYVSGGGDDVDPLTLPDAKDFRPILQFAAKFEEGAGDRTPAEILAEVDALLATKPDAFELRMRRLMLLARLDRQDEARLFAEETATMFPGRARVWLMLASMAMQEKEPAQALVYARKGVEADPAEAAAREAVVSALFELQQPEEALKEAEAALAADPKNYGVAALLGQYYLGKRDFQNAERHLRLAVTGPTPRRAARAQLAMLALAAGARADAYNLLEAEVGDYPGNQMARQVLSRMYAEDQRWLDQRDHAAFLARANPNAPAPIRALAQCLFNLGDYAAARGAMDMALFIAPDDPDSMLLNANLLAKEGKREEGLEMLKAANVANEKRIEAQKAAAAAAEKAGPHGKPGAAPGKPGTAPGKAGAAPGKKPTAGAAAGGDK